MILKGRIINKIINNDSSIVLSVERTDLSAVENIYIVISINSLRNPDYKFDSNEIVTIEFEPEKINLFGIEKIEFVASVITNEKGVEIANIVTCDFPY